MLAASPPLLYSDADAAVRRRPVHARRQAVKKKASIIKHEREPHPDDDPTHPIPCPGVLDMLGIRKGGGADLAILVAAPLMADERSQMRLLHKIAGYLRHIHSRAHQSQAGEPTAANTTIRVVLHPGTAPEIHELLDRCKPWTLDHDATLKVELLDQAVH